ncbi:hypothetical protein Vi05172_g12382 [Venturia inaequalis]|nr:hypothetical protein Vi05172_g12382 [Venturia inaequalis]
MTMDDPFNGDPRRPPKLFDDYRLNTPTSNDSSFRTQRLRQSLPTMDAMFQSIPSQEDHEMEHISHPSHEFQTLSAGDTFQAGPRKTQFSTNHSLQPQPHRSQSMRNDSFQPQPYRPQRQPQLPMANPFQPQPRQPQPQPLHRSNTEFYPGRQAMMNDPFEPQPSQHPIFPPAFPPPLPTQQRQLTSTEEEENPFWIPRASKPPKEPMPTRHRRFKDSFSTIPEHSAMSEDYFSGNPTGAVTCEGCIRYSRVAREYWDRNKELEEEAGEKDEFIAKLKEQRRVLELQVGELLGVVEGRR